MADSFLKIAQDAALATTGVSGISFPGVLPIPKDKGLDLEVYVIVEYGVKIPEVAWNIQENVKAALANIQNLKIERVNIHIESIHFKEKEIL